MTHDPPNAASEQNDDSAMSPTTTGAGTSGEGKYEAPDTAAATSTTSDGDAEPVQTDVPKSKY